MNDTITPVLASPVSVGWFCCALRRTRARTLLLPMPALDEVTFAPGVEPSLGPFLLEPVLVERIWGVRDLSPWHTQTVDAGAVGEIWLTAESCKASTGPWAGRTLAEITAAFPEQMGDSRHEGFPLLIKLLFPREKLSVQVHPDDAQAQAQGMPRGKTECWYVLSAEPGAQVAVGFNEPLTTAEVRASIEAGDLEARLRMLPVHAGDMIFVDAGTVHAIGPGMVVLETQQYSDTTYRLWDYGRPRELHVEAGTAVTRTDTAAGLVSPEARDGFTRLVSCPYFAVDRFRADADISVGLERQETLQILIAVAGEVAVGAAGGSSQSLPRGRAAVLPAGVTPLTLRLGKGAEVVRVLQP